MLGDADAATYNYHRPDRSPYERITETVRSELGDTTFAQIRKEGQAMPFGEAVELGLAPGWTRV